MSTKTIKITIDELIDKFRIYNSNPDDEMLIRKAYEYAENDRPYKTGNQAKVDACNANLEACLAYFVTEVEVTFDGINGGVADTVLDGEGNPVLDENGFQTGYVYGIPAASSVDTVKT